jgi:catechol 2,3-dioxygenase-like lactoylglutathione lyase family enzyme
LHGASSALLCRNTGGEADASYDTSRAWQNANAAPVAALSIYNNTPRGSTRRFGEAIIVRSQRAVALHTGKLPMVTARHPHGRLWRILIPGLGLLIHAAIASTPLVIADQEAPDQPVKETRMKYVEAREQLIVELYVRDVKQSTAFYEQLGFAVVRREPTFVELGWDDSRMYLEQIPGQADPPATLVANVRIMVGDVDRYWKLCQDMKLPVKRAIGDRYYGLRDFTVVAPDGIGLRFAAKLAGKATP